jgi:hypothetical protein
VLVVFATRSDKIETKYRRQAAGIIVPHYVVAYEKAA